MRGFILLVLGGALAACKQFAEAEAEPAHRHRRPKHYAAADDLYKDFGESPLEALPSVARSLDDQYLDVRKRVCVVSAQAGEYCVGEDTKRVPAGGEGRKLRWRPPIYRPPRPKRPRPKPPRPQPQPERPQSSMDTDSSNKIYDVDVQPQFYQASNEDQDTTE